MLDMSHSATMKGMYIGGQWVPGRGSFADINPCDGTMWADIPDGGAAEAVKAFPRQALHAAVLGFRHPVTDKTVTFEAPMPEDMVSLLDKIRATVS